MTACGRLLRIRENPDDEEARVNCQFGSWLSAFGLQARVPMGASHAIGHVLGGTCDVPHYFCTAVMMPSVLRYNRPATEEAQKSIAAALRAPDLNASDAFAAFIGKLGLPRKLSEVGVSEDKFRLIGENAMLSIFTRATHTPWTIGKGDDTDAPSINHSRSWFWTLLLCLVPGDWLNGIGVDRGVCYVRERLASWN